MTTPPDSMSVVEAVYAAFGTRNVPALIALASPDSQWIVNAPKEHPFGGTFRGHTGFQQLLGRIAASTDVHEFGVDEMHVPGDDVFVIGHEKGRWKSNGKSYASRWMHRFRVKDGKVVLFEEWFDSASTMATLR
jgi:ketosteroid isomerase-like protein